MVLIKLAPLNPGVCIRRVFGFEFEFGFERFEFDEEFTELFSILKAQPDVSNALNVCFVVKC